MKKIGILFGQRILFMGLYDRVNEKNESGIIAEAVTVDVVQQANLPTMR